MKKNAIPELDAAWWRKNQADGLASAKELEKALEEHTQCLRALEASKSANDLATCVKAADAVEQAVKKVQTEAAKALKNPPKGKFDEEDMRSTVDALARYQRVIATAREAAAKLVAEDDSVFGQPERYKEYLRDMLSKLRQGPMMFALGASTVPTEHRMAFHRTTKGASLASQLHNATQLKKLAFGVARADAARATTLVLELESPLMAGMNAKFQRIRKQFGPLLFDRVVVVVQGQEVVDAADPQDPVDSAEPMDRIDSANPSTDPSTNASAQINTEGMRTWQAARESAVNQLRKLGAAIVATQDPDARAALVRLQAVTKNLTPAPSTPQSVTELQRYLETDDVFPDLESSNPFGLDLTLRAPLLSALAALKPDAGSGAPR